MDGSVRFRPARGAAVTQTELAVLAAVVASVVVFGGATVLAMGWAFRSGQFENFGRASRSIFGPDEPVGQPTDAFPTRDEPE
jgi:cbb3-type cytochrome oxidase maturation protein